MSKQQKILLTSIVLFLLGGLVLAAYLARQIVKPTPRAAENEVTLTLQPSNPNPAPGEQITVALFAAPPANGTQVRTLAAYLEYNESIQIIEVERSREDPFIQWDYIKARNNPTKSRVEILASYKPLEAEPDPAGYLAGNIAAEFATIKLVWGDPEQDLQIPGYLEFVLDPATSGAKDPDGNDVPVATASLLIPAIPSPPLSPSISPPPLERGALHLEPSSGQYNPDQTFATKILLDTGGEDVTSVDAFLSFDPRIVEVEAVEEGTIAEFTQFQQNVDQANGKVYLEASVDNPNAVVNGNGLHLATIAWHSLPSITLPGGETPPTPPLVSTAITFDCIPGSTDDSNITRADPDGTDILNCALITNGSYTIEFPPFPADKPTLYLSPSTGKINAGQLFTTTIYLSTGGNDASGVDAVLTFNPQVVNVVSTAKGKIPEFIAYFESIDNDAGRVTVSALISPDVTEVEQTASGPTPRPNQTPVNGQGLTFGTVTFKALPIVGASHDSPPARVLKTPVNFDFTPGEKNDSNIAEYHEGGDILEETYGATYTISYEEVVGPSLKLRLELCDEPSQRKVYLTLPDDTLIETTLSGENDDHAHTTNPVNIPAGTQSLNVRVAGYLAHTFKLPSSWTNLIDLSYFTLLGGDIDGSGKVNVLDFNLFKSDYLKHEETPADLDCSDQVNSLDYDGIIRNWNKTSN